MTENRDEIVYLDDILDAAAKAQEFAHGLTFEEFKRDERTVFAVIRALEIIGEAAKQVPSDTRERAPGIPWSEMTGMRDKLIHAYQGIDLVVVWRTVQEDLPQAVPLIRELRSTFLDSD